MKKLNPKTNGASLDIVRDNTEKITELFPDVLTEGKIDFDVLRETLGDYIDDKPERYSFTWNGKSRARRISQTPSTGTLRPCQEDSINWNTTQNIFTEGDNLEVLKLLQKSYHKRIKMIYIDPPYNTGNDFIYPDDFHDNIKNYMELTGQTDEEGRKFSVNAETAGRYHTNWLNMIYPRLKLARNLLQDDGVIFVSIDDCEVANLRRVCDEVFGVENFIAQIVWQKRVSPANDAKWYSGDHEYVVVYARSKEEWYPKRTQRTEDHNKYYKNPDGDHRGLWNSAAYTCNKSRSERPNLYYPIVNPNTGDKIWPDENAVWAYSQEKHDENVSNNLLYWGANGRSKFPRRKKFLLEASPVVPRSIWPYGEVGSTQTATTEARELFGGASFTYPKSVGLLKKAIYQATDKDDIVLDFFAGSCTAAQAMLEQNMEDSCHRRFIMVQLPEPCNEKSEAFKAGYPTITEIGKERIRRVIKKLKTEQAKKTKQAKEKLPGMAAEVLELDLGFKVFKLDASNIKPWDADFDNLEDSLFNAVENIKPNRSEADVLYELLLKYGLDLAAPIEERKLFGKTVYIIGAGALIVCLAKQISLEAVEGIAALKDELKPEVMRVVFKDSGFKDDVVKTNAVQILRQAGIDDVKSL